MPQTYVSLLVHVPECARFVGAGQKVPVLIYVDPPGAKVDVCVHLHPDCTEKKCPTQDIKLSPYNKIVWIDNLPEKKDHTLCVQASADKLSSAFHRGKIRREFPQNAKGKKSAAKPLGTDPPEPPTICYPVPPTPPYNLPTNFPSYGFIDPSSDTVTVWLVDGSNNVYPGAPVVPPPTPYDWAAAFQGIPTGAYTLYAEDTVTGASSSVSITVQ
jgi:hypothetical protein